MDKILKNIEKGFKNGVNNSKTFNNPLDLEDIVGMCNAHLYIEYFDPKENSWKKGQLVGIRRFSWDFMFTVHVIGTGEVSPSYFQKIRKI